MAIKKQKLLTEQDYKKKIDKARNSNKNKNNNLNENFDLDLVSDIKEKKSYFFILKYFFYFLIFLFVIAFIIAPKPKTYYYMFNGMEQKSIFIPSSLLNDSFVIDSYSFNKISIKEIEKEKFIVFCSSDKLLKCQQYKINKEDSLISTLINIKNNYYKK